MSGRKVGIPAIQGLKMFSMNCKYVKANPDLIDHLKSLNDAQAIVDRLHEELEKQYSEELDWLYSTFFTISVAPSWMIPTSSN